MTPLDALLLWTQIKRLSSSAQPCVQDWKRGDGAISASKFTPEMSADQLAGIQTEQLPVFHLVTVQAHAWLCKLSGGDVCLRR